MTPSPAEPRRILYGRRRGRRLRAGQRALIDELLPALAVELPPPGARIDPEALFGRAMRDLWLEIGFGAGEHLAWQARAHPEIGMIGCEPFVTGVAGLLRRIRDEGLDNVRIFTDDARLLLEALPPQSLGRAFVLFPDPWPKKRHHKRRIVAPRTLEAFAAALKDGAELRVSSDDAPYVRWILEHVRGHPAFEWPARTPGDWRGRPDDWPQTRYEVKARGGARTCYFLRFRRRPRPRTGAGRAAESP